MLERKNRKISKIKKVDSSKYGQYCFRVPVDREEKFQEILLTLGRVHALYEAARNKDEQIFKRNEIIIDALERGLSLIEQNLSENIDDE